MPELIALEQKMKTSAAAEGGHGSKAESGIAAAATEDGSGVGREVAKATRIRRKRALTKGPSAGTCPHIPTLNAVVTQGCLEENFMRQEATA